MNDRKGVQKLVELVGGTWGQIPLEHRFELVEKALYRCQQKPDETGDSFIARVDVVWTELLTKDVDMDQIRSYVLLRGSRLSAEDKKRVLVESGAEQIGQKTGMEEGRSSHTHVRFIFLSRLHGCQTRKEHENL